jgi:hypothetical protein
MSLNDHDRELVREVVQETLEALGADVARPHETQADFAFLRRQRRGSEELGRWGRRAVLGAAFSGLVWFLIEGFRAALGPGQ